MAYLALARKHRPQTFEQVIGHQPVIQALTNTLNSQSMHHAYLLTGTRGVGKTSLARLIAKALNCEKGISATPCRQCQSCRLIERSEFIDVFEIDAASRTRVEDTRDILDNVQYSPVQGRFKIYIIDEVHMLSTHSFNALLKTLEEPPAHVKFLLATTDAQKLPETVLSRCFQLYLKPLPDALISEHLTKLLQNHQIDYEKEAIQLLAQNAQGSIRDALSLLDRALALSPTNVTTQHIHQMLGLTPASLITEIGQAIVKHHIDYVIAKTSELKKANVDPEQLLNRLAHLWYCVTYYQLTANHLDVFFDHHAIEHIARSCSPEIVQLLYDITIKSVNDLSYAQDAYTCLNMTFLRMIAFYPESEDVSQTDTNTDKTQLNQNRALSNHADTFQSQQNDGSINEPTDTDMRNQTSYPNQNSQTLKGHIENGDDWYHLVERLNLKGATRQLALNSQFIQYDALYARIKLRCMPECSHLLTNKRLNQLNEEIKRITNEPIQLYYVNNDTHQSNGYNENSAYTSQNNTTDESTFLNSPNNLESQTSNKRSQNANSNTNNPYVDQSETTVQPLNNSNTLTPAEKKAEHHRRAIENAYQTFSKSPIVQALCHHFQTHINRDNIRIIDDNA